MGLMAWLHRQGEAAALPEKRQVLYEKSVEHLIDLWQRDKPLYDEHGNLKGKEYDVFRELGISPDNLRRALNQLAYEAHRDQPELTGTHDIAVARLAGVLFDAARREDQECRPQRIIEYVTNRAGMLVERSQGRVYRFPHRTFQEYLAACHLTVSDFPVELGRRLREDDQRWREAVLLAAAKTVFGGTPAAIWWLVDEFCPEGWDEAAARKADWYAVLRAAQAVVETEQQCGVSATHDAKPGRLRGRLARLLQMPETLRDAPRDLAETGRALSRLEDPRPGVTVKHRGEVQLPDILWARSPRANALRFQRRWPRLLRSYRAGEMRHEELNARVRSWVAHARHGDTYGLRRSLFNQPAAIAAGGPA